MWTWYSPFKKGLIIGVVALITIAIILFIVVIITVGTPDILKPTDLDDFIRGIQGEYPFVKSIKCTYSDRSGPGYTITCVLKEKKTDEEITALISILKEYALSEAVFNAYCYASVWTGADRPIVTICIYNDNRYDRYSSYFKCYFDGEITNEPWWKLP